MQSEIDKSNLNEALNTLSIDEKLSFWTTVSETDAQAAIEGSAQMKEEFGKLSEDNQKALVEIIEKTKTDPTLGAPFLELANAKGKAWCLQETKDMTPEEMQAVDMDPEKKKAWMEKYHAYVQAELKPIYEKAFARHDTDHSGKVNKEQAVVFFRNLIAQCKDAGDFMMENYSEPIALQLLGKEGNENPSDEEKKAKAEKVRGCFKPAMEAIEKAYLENKEASDTAAFDALADGGDGISFETFIQLFMDESEVQTKAIKIFGFDPESCMAKVGELAA